MDHGIVIKPHITAAVYSYTEEDQTNDNYTVLAFSQSHPDGTGYQGRLVLNAQEAYRLAHYLLAAVDRLVPGAVNPVPEDDPNYPEAVKFLMEV
jgi:hypothetical protein